MNQQERSMIEGLFQRLQQAETQAGPRDTEAEALINDQMSRQSAAPYLLAQVVLVQEQGLQQLQTRIEALEQQLAERPQGGGFLGGLFGGPQKSAAPRQPGAGGSSNSRFPAQGAAGSPASGQGGGFMAGAMQTAMGVAGGVLLANALGGLFSGEAEAAEIPAEAVDEAPDVDETSSDGLFGDFFGGGDDEEF